MILFRRFDKGVLLYLEFSAHFDFFDNVESVEHLLFVVYFFKGLWDDLDDWLG